MKILIAGCGRLGGAIARFALSDGHVVFGLRRRTSLLPDGVRPIRADLARLDAATLPDGIDLCLCTVSADAREPGAYREAYVEGLSRLVSALRDARRSPGARLVYTSSTGVYGESSGGAVDETTDPAPLTERGRVLLEAERMALENSGGSVVARLSGLYGPGRTRLLDAVRAGRARGAPGRGPWTNRVHEEDAARAVLHVATLERPESLYVVSDDEPVRRGDVLAWLARRTGSALDPDDATDPAGRGDGKRCVNDRLCASGFAFRYPSYREGYEALLAAQGAT